MPYLLKTYEDEDPIVIAEGNSKMGNIPNVSLPPVISCAPGAPCGIRGCYSKKYMNIRPSVRNARFYNWRVWNTNPDKYFADLNTFLDIHKPEYFRFHSDGDIPDQDYLDRMNKLAKHHKRIRFLAFTKRYFYDYTECPPNMQIVFSAWPGMYLPRTILLGSRPIAWAQDGGEERMNRPYLDCEGHCDECYVCWHLDEIEQDIVFKRR